MGLYLYSRPINQFFKSQKKGSIRPWRWSEWFEPGIFDSFFNLESIHNNSFLFHKKKYVFFFIKRNTYLVVIFELVFRCVYIVYIPLSFILYRVSIFDRSIHFTFFFLYQKGQSTPFVRTASIESLHLSPFFAFWTPVCSWKREEDLAQDYPFLIPGFLWIWKLSLSKFPY